MKHEYVEKVLKVNDIYLDEENPRFPPVSSQREAIKVMLKEEGGKIVTLAKDIYENGVNPSSKIIIFRDKGKYVDGDGNRRLTAIKILETPDLSSSERKLRKKIDNILKGSGEVPTSVGCIIYDDRDSASHWISINHNGQQDGKGQVPWNSEQRSRFERKHTIGLQALDFLSSKKLIALGDRGKINKTTLDRLLSYKKVKERLCIEKRGEFFVFDAIQDLRCVVLYLRDKKVDAVYTADKGFDFVEAALLNAAKFRESESGAIEDGVSFHDSTLPRASHYEDHDVGKTEKSFKPVGMLGALGGRGAQSDQNYHSDKSLSDDSEEKRKGAPARSRRIKRNGIIVFGGPLSLSAGHVNNLYRDIELIHNNFSNDRESFSEDFVVVFRMSLRMLTETAAKDVSDSLSSYVDKYFDKAKSLLDKDLKTTLANQSIESSKKVVQLFHTGAHDYYNSRNEEQALALSVIVGAMLGITHGKEL